MLVASYLNNQYFITDLGVLASKVVNGIEFLYRRSFWRKGWKPRRLGLEIWRYEVNRDLSFIVADIEVEYGLRSKVD